MMIPEKNKRVLLAIMISTIFITWMSLQLSGRQGNFLKYRITMTPYNDSLDILKQKYEEPSCYYVDGDHRKKKPAKELKRLGCAHRFPTALNLGVKKCGTGALRYFLNLHPQVEVKGEPHHLHHRDGVSNVMNRWIKSMSLTTPEQALVAEFQYSLNTYANIYPSEQLRFIFILRDPVTRAISDYVHVQHKSSKIPPPFPVTYRTEQVDRGKPRTFKVYKDYELLSTFEETITTRDNKVNASHRFIKNGIYISRIRRLINKVGRDRVHVVDGDKFKNKPVPVLKDLELFLGLDPFFNENHFQLDSSGKYYCPNVKERPDVKCFQETNTGKGKTHPEVNETILQMLREFYQPYNRRLQKFLNQTFIWVN